MRTHEYDYVCCQMENTECHTHVHSEEARAAASIALGDHFTILILELYSND